MEQIKLALIKQSRSCKSTNNGRYKNREAELLPYLFYSPSFKTPLALNVNKPK